MGKLYPIPVRPEVLEIPQYNKLWPNASIDIVILIVFCDSDISFFYIYLKMAKLAALQDRKNTLSLYICSFSGD